MDEKQKLIRQVIDLQRRINYAMGRCAAEPWLGLNLTIAQLKSLVFISNKGVTNSRALAQALGVTPPNVTGIVDRLVEQRLITRQEDPQDRRRLQLRATPKGEAMLQGLRERAMTEVSEILSTLNREDLLLLIRGLSSLAKAIEAKRREKSEND